MFKITNSTSSRIARRFWVLLPAKPHRERELGLCTSRQKSVCEACRLFGESESECIRESSKKCGGQEKAGLSDGRKRKWCRVAKWLGESSQLSWVCVVSGRAVLPCVISGRGTVFFYYRQNTVHKGLRNYLPSSPLPPVLLCARALARLARTKLSRLLL